MYSSQFTDNQIGSLLVWWEWFHPYIFIPGTSQTKWKQTRVTKSWKFYCQVFLKAPNSDRYILIFSLTICFYLRKSQIYIYVWYWKPNKIWKNELNVPVKSFQFDDVVVNPNKFQAIVTNRHPQLDDTYKLVIHRNNLLLVLTFLLYCCKMPQPHLMLVPYY